MSQFDTATLAGGCFWYTEAIYKRLKGVTAVVSGYAASQVENPSYEEVCSGRTGAAEAIQITYDPSIISYEKLLEIFWHLHDPTTPNRQGNDVGTQYRSAIFYENDEQKRTAEKVKARVEASGKWKRPITTEIVAATEFWPAEDSHQNYLQKHPGGYTCHYLR